MSNINDFVIEDGVLKKYIGTDAEVVVPDSVTSIAYSAFENCKFLTSVIIPDSVTSIGNHAFRNCKLLTNATIGETVTSIGYCAFLDCTSLANINIPTSVKSIGESAFRRCSSLRNVIIHINDVDMFWEVLSWSDALNILVAPQISFEVLKKKGVALAATMGYLLNSEMFVDHPDKEQYLKYVSSQRKKILPEIFQKDLVECLSIYSEIGTLTKKNFEDEFFTSAQEYNAPKCVAFLMEWKNNNISSEDVSRQLKKEFTKDPYNVTDMKKIWSYEKLEDGTLAITSYKGNDVVITIPERIGQNKVSRIAQEAFSTAKSGRNYEAGQKLKKIVEIIIPDSVTSIGERAFVDCTSLTNVKIPDSVNEIGEAAFIACTSLASINIPNAVTSIADSTFERCTSLVSVTISDAVTSIGRGAFDNCKSLTSIVIPGTVNSIMNSAFSRCTSLTSITLPISVTNIGQWAFYDCPSLIDIYYAGSKEEWQNISIEERNDPLHKATIHFGK